MNGITPNSDKLRSLALVAMVVLSVFAGSLAFAGGAAAHSLTFTLFEDTGANYVNETSAHTSATFSTASGEKPNLVEVNVSSTSSSVDGSLNLERYNDSSGAWELVDTVMLTSTGPAQIDVSASETFDESNEYRLYLDAYSGASYQFDSLSVSGTSANTAPTISSHTGSQTITVGDALNLSVDASDADGDTLTPDISIEDPSGSSMTYSDKSYVDYYSFDEAGNYTVTYTATDSHGATDTNTVTITVDEQTTATYPVTFNVTDSNATSLANATVNVTDSNSTVVATLTTDANGSAVANLADGNYSYVVSATDFAESTGDISVSGASQTIDVTLSASTTTTTPDDDSSGGGFVPGGGASTAIIVVLVLAGALVALGERED